VNAPARKKERESKLSLKKMLETLEPYLPPKPKSKQLPCGEWEIAGSSISENLVEEETEPKPVR